MSGQNPSRRRKMQWRWPLFGALLLVIVLVPSTAIGVSVRMENNDGFCASCHTHPESDYVQIAQAARSGEATSKDLAAFHAGAEQPVTCIQCHSGQGVSGRVDALLLGARDLTAYTRGNYPQPAPLTHPIPDGNCLKCHQDVYANQSFDNHFHVFLPRWQRFAGDRAASCVDCHTSHKQDGEVDLGFLNQQRVIAQCDACHRVVGE